MRAAAVLKTVQRDLILAMETDAVRRTEGEKHRTTLPSRFASTPPLTQGRQDARRSCSEDRATRPPSGDGDGRRQADGGREAQDNPFVSLRFDTSPYTGEAGCAPQLF